MYRDKIFHVIYLFYFEFLHQLLIYLSVRCLARNQFISLQILYRNISLDNFALLANEHFGLIFALVENNAAYNTFDDRDVKLVRKSSFLEQKRSFFIFRVKDQRSKNKSKHQSKFAFIWGSDWRVFKYSTRISFFSFMNEFMNEIII